MSTTSLDAAPFSRARTTLCAARENDFALLEAVAEIDVLGTGYPSVERLLEDLLHIDRRDAKRLVRHAAALVPGVSLSGEPLPPRLPATAGVCAAGLIGPGHVEVVLTALARLAQVPAAVLAEAEEALAEAATYLPPRALAKVADRLVATLDPDGVAPDDDDVPDDELHLGTRRDGTLCGTFRFHHGADRELIREVLDALSAPAGPDDPRSLATRQAEAFLDLIAHAASPTGIATDTRHTTTDNAPDDDAPDDDEADGYDAVLDHDGESDDGGFAGFDDDSAGRDDPGRHHTESSHRPDTPASHPDPAGPPNPPGRPLGRGTLTVTMDLQWLREQTGHGRLDSETTISPTEARRIACDAGILPMILGSRSEPLDVGRLTYTVPRGLRRALVHRDHGCAFPGCTRRPNRCAAHHIRHWAEGGDTALHNTTLLCRYHHRLIHQDHWRIRMVHGRPCFTPPPWLDPDQTPIPGGRSPL